MTKNKLEDTDLYELLGIQLKADITEIKKAYRKKALECHPDKNPDNPKAAELFHELSKALEILVDASARAAYDKVLTAKKAAKLRLRELDSKRQKLIEDLERREKEAERRAKGNKTYDDRTDEERLQEEIRRLRTEGSKLLEEEQERMRQHIFAEADRLSSYTPLWNSSENRIKINWTASKDDKTNGGYCEEMLRQFFKKYGDVTVLILSSKKKGSALVEFATKEASEMALELEKGLEENPLTLKWINDKKTSSRAPPSRQAASSEATLVSDKDYESLVMRKLRQAAERQKLIDDMMKEDKE